MSMIYECPNCHTPQASGRTVCRHCGAEFDNPVPDDAFVPDGTAPEPASPESIVAAGESDPAGPAVLEAEGSGETVSETVSETVYESPIVQEAKPVAAAEVVPQEALVEGADPLTPQADTTAPPPRSAAPPPAPAETLPYQSPPYQSPPYPTPEYQAAPTYADQADTAAPSPPAPPRPPLSKALTRVLLIAFPIVLVVVLSAVYFAHSLESGQDTAPAPLPALTPAPTPTATPKSLGTPAAPPYVLNGTVATAGANEDPRTRRMVGRWESKNLDFYVFNENKTGTRGNLTGKGPQGIFLWTLVQNHLILYGDKQEQLTYSKGPDEDTMFLRAAHGGKYVQYARTKP